jgi:hypothetical protein
MNEGTIDSCLEPWFCAVTSSASVLALEGSCVLETKKKAITAVHFLCNSSSPAGLLSV